MPRDNFNNWYKSHFDKLSDAPPEKVWENVSAQLDTDKVWTSISHLLDRKERRRKRGVVLIILFFLLASGYFVIDNYSERTPTKAFSHNLKEGSTSKTGMNGETEKSEIRNPGTANTKETFNITTIDLQSRYGNQGGGEIADHPSPVEATPPDVFGAETVTRNNVTPNYVVETSREDDSIQFPSVASIPVRLPLLNDTKIGHLNLEMIEIPADTITAPRTTFFTTGISCVGSYSGLIDQHYIRSLKKKTTNSVSIAPDISGEVFAEKISRNNFGIGGFACFNSAINQTYHGYYEGQFLSNEIRMKTFKAGAYFAWYWDRKINKPFGPENCFVAGITGNVITSKYYSGRDGESYNPKNMVTYYPGVMVGAKKYKLVFPGFFIHAGINVEASITNVYNGEPGIPKDFFRTHIVTSSVTAGISYRFVNH